MPYVDYELSNAPKSAGCLEYGFIALAFIGAIFVIAALLASTNPAWIVP